MREAISNFFDRLSGDDVFRGFVINCGIFAVSCLILLHVAGGVGDMINGAWLPAHLDQGAVVLTTYDDGSGIDIQLSDGRRITYFQCDCGSIKAGQKVAVSFHTERLTGKVYADKNDIWWISN